MKRSVSLGNRFFAALSMAAILLAGCGGGGEGTTSSSPGAGPAVVSVSIGTSTPTGEQAGPLTAAGSAAIRTTDPDFLWPQAIQAPGPQIAHVYMDILRVSLLPSDEPSVGGDMGGSVSDSGDAAAEDGSGSPRFITMAPDAPVRIDLMEGEAGKKLARFLGRFEQVPAGSYDKIRVHYGNVQVLLADGTELRFHPTAGSKFDLHFRQGSELVFPATSGAGEEGRIRLYRVDIDLVGLKLKVVEGGKGWNGAKVILRPEIFAEFVAPVLYSVSGTVSNVRIGASPAVSGTFDVWTNTGGAYPLVVSAAFENGTAWGWSDDVLARSSRIVPVPNEAAVGAFRENAVVEVVGSFDAGRLLRAEEILVSFPDRLEGAVDGGWGADNTFRLRTVPDIVRPMPDRPSAYYDAEAAPHAPLTSAAVADNALVRARGYATPDGIEAFWISVAVPE